MDFREIRFHPEKVMTFSEYTGNYFENSLLAEIWKLGYIGTSEGGHHDHYHDKQKPNHITQKDR